MFFYITSTILLYTYLHPLSLHYAHPFCLDLARTFSPEETLGRANVLVNIGGFVASLMTMALIGIILDLLEPAGATAYDLTDFRVAMCAQYVFWLLGIVQILRYRRKAIPHLERTHPGAVETL